LRERMERQVSAAHAGDCGVDLFVNSIHLTDEPIPPQITIGTGVKVAAYDDRGRPTGCLLYPRSSLSKTPFMLANSVGVIDAGYRGEVLAKLNRIPNSHYQVNLSQEGLRLVQICLPTLRPPRVVFVDSQ
jgi:dUTP pyrophosphatase